MGAPLAIGEEATTVYADPKQVRNAQRVAVEAGHALALDPNKIYPQLLDKKQSFVYVQRKADPERAAALERRGLAGLDFYPEERRSYPQHTVASQVLGYAGVDNTGIAGLELGLERSLAGKPGRETVVRDPFGRTIDVVSSTPEQPGRDVFLDARPHAPGEGRVGAARRRWRSGTRPTGRRSSSIRAPAACSRWRAPPASTRTTTRRCRAASSATAPSRTRTSRARPSRSSPTRRRSPTRRHPELRPSRSLRRSTSRTGRSTRPSRGRPRRCPSRRCSPGRRTSARSRSPSCSAGSDSVHGSTDSASGRPQASTSRERAPGSSCRVDKWSGSTIGNVPIGQGIAVTPIQMASRVRRAREPRRVARAAPRRPRAGHASRRRSHRRRVVSPTIARELIGMLQGVVSRRAPAARRRCRATWSRGRREPRRSPTRTAATRTRTTSPRSSGSSRPARRALVILVSIDEPQGQIFGGLVAAPAFRDIARFALQYLDVPPDDPASLKNAAGRAARAEPPRRSPRPPPHGDRSVETAPAASVRREKVQHLSHFGDDLGAGRAADPLLDSLVVDLERLIAVLAPAEVVGRADTTIRDLAYDARAADAGSLFFCVPGERADGHDFAAEAIRNGAVALVVQRPLDVPVPQLVVADSRAAMAVVADEFFGRPTEELAVAGVTGTSGQDDDGVPALRGARGGGPPAGAARDDRDPGRRRAARRRRGRPPRRSTSSGSSARCSTRATAAARWRRPRTARRSAVSTGSGSPCSSSPTSTGTTSTSTATMEDYFDAKRRLFLGDDAPPAAVNVGDAVRPAPGRRAARARARRCVTFGLDRRRRRLSAAGRPVDGIAVARAPRPVQRRERAGRGRRRPPAGDRRRGDRRAGSAPSQACPAASSPSTRGRTSP